jgi:transcription initiation factor IIE alpha subunit
MKVIKKGNEKIHEVTCNVCNSDLEYTDNDTFYTEVEKQGLIRRTVSHIFREDEEYVEVQKVGYICVKCPVCNNTIKTLDVDSLYKNFGDKKWKRIK